MSERPTVRPVTLARLIEVTHACKGESQTTAEIEAALNVSHRRARETILEALRVGLIDEHNPEDSETWFLATQIGVDLVKAVRDENWDRVNNILEAQSPHYRALLQSLKETAPTDLETILRDLQTREQSTGRTYNQTSVEVLGDWGERLGRIQRNAFTGTYYPVERDSVTSSFTDHLLSVFDDLEETGGVSLRQRYLSIPKLREHYCEQFTCPRDPFDKALVRLAEQNVGRVELSGAPVDTVAKDAKLGIKSMTIADSGSLVSTNQSTDKVMRGVEQFGKRYYYLAVHDRDLEYDPNNDD
ncbi:hypothetical protein KTS45_11140 [Halomicroarcula limicola]|uniref:Uncharacterized protein n=1 Tax=Haloarcula limicola TaxID=1429915 RepID=A0A8J7YBC0_9EURY|nr:hypothetical protein [Halomicroarcula limicola]MBV0924754.1 hypothetical protein [Halomicroarcula limicola]